jgi:hypothetical protein
VATIARLAIERALHKFSRLVSPEFNRAIERWRQADTEARGGDLLTQAYSDIFSNRSGSVAPELNDHGVADEGAGHTESPANCHDDSRVPDAPRINIQRS